ncbi:MAG: response regulator [Gemmatimonadota bacterium]
MSDSRPTVVAVDDGTSVRESLRLLIESSGWRAETFESGREFLIRPRTIAPSCLVLDVVLPELGGCDLQRLVADRVDLPIIFISGHGVVPLAVRAMKAGAVDFFTKPFDADSLLRAIGNALERSRAAMAAAASMREVKDCYASLSLREREVMALVVAGRLNKEAGSTLGISEVTVKAHRGKVMRKMNAGSLSDLVHFAMRLRHG